MHLLTKERQTAVEQVISDRFSGAVEDCKFSFRDSEAGEEVLEIKVFIKKGTSDSALTGKLFGLTRMVREALGRELADVFPVITPMESRAGR